jgi:hypothetical protein
LVGRFEETIWLKSNELRTFKAGFTSILKVTALAAVSLRLLERERCSGLL